MFCFSEKIIGVSSSLFMLCYSISFLCNDFRFVEPCFFLLSIIVIGSVVSELLAYIVLFIFKGEK